MTKKAYGIVASADGSYVMSSLRLGASGWRVSRIRQWESDDRMRAGLLLDRPVIVGVPTHWQSREFAIRNEAFVKPSGALPFIPCGEPVTLDLHAKALAKNLAGIVPQEAFLATIPLFFGDVDAGSFVAVHTTETHYQIGVTIDKQLVFVFNAAPAEREALGGHLTRVERYCAKALPGKTFPSLVYVMGGESALDDSRFTFGNLKIPDGADLLDNSDALRAAGVALTRLAPAAVPRLSGETQRSGLRKIRSAAYAASAALVVLGATAVVCVLAANLWLSRQLTIEKTRYRTILATNSDIKQLIEKNEALAQKILRSRQAASSHTRWARLLDILGKDRPDGIFFDRLGSEAVKGSADEVRLAFTGWATGEALVTALMKKLQEEPFLSHIQLSSLQRDEHEKGICRFRIYCTMKLVDDSTEKK